MSRSTWKGPFTEITAGQLQNKTQVWSRRSMILPYHLGREFLVYNGKNFVSVKVLEEMCSHKFGEFAITRKKPLHKVSKKKQMQKKTPR